MRKLKKHIFELNHRDMFKHLRTPTKSKIKKLEHLHSTALE